MTYIVLSTQLKIPGDRFLNMNIKFDYVNSPLFLCIYEVYARSWIIKSKMLLSFFSNV